MMEGKEEKLEKGEKKDSKFWVPIKMFFCPNFDVLTIFLNVLLEENPTIDVNDDKYTLLMIFPNK